MRALPARWGQTGPAGRAGHGAWRRGAAAAAVAAATMVTAAVPLVAGGDSASASQQGQDHKVTLCHRTNSEHNPYVVITIDKAGVFKHGHDGHDEGGVYQAGDKANGIRWGDIIPAFDYYATPKDQAAGTVSHYPGLNNTAEGLQVLANGCQVPSTPPTTTTAPPQTTSPSGSLTVDCTSSGGTVTIGTLSTGSDTGGHFELVVDGTPQTVQSGQTGIAVPAQSSLVLRYVASDSTTTTLDTDTAPAACTSTTTTPPPPGETRGLTVTKSVTPTGAASIGETLTYSLAVTTTGNAAQTDVTVSDYLPGYRPGSASGTTTYVAGSATCGGSGTCATSYDAGTHQVTWGLGTLPAGSTRTVSFQVTIDRPAGSGDAIPAFDVANTGVVGSAQVAPVTSNRVVTPVAAVEAVKTGTHTSSGTHGSGTSVAGTKSGNLPHTGAARTGALVGTGCLLLLLGTVLVAKPELALGRSR